MLDNVDSKANINAATEEHSSLMALQATAGGRHFSITKLLVNNNMSKYIAELAKTSGMKTQLGAYDLVNFKLSSVRLVPSDLVPVLNFKPEKKTSG